MTGTSPRRNADSVRPECAASLTKSAPPPRCSHRCGDGLVNLGKRASRRCGRTGRFRGDHNGGQEISLSCQYQRPQSRGDHSFYQPLADTSAWRPLYPAGIASCAAGIVSGRSSGEISQAPTIWSSAKPIKMGSSLNRAPHRRGFPLSAREAGPGL